MTNHQPVLVAEVIKYLAPKTNENYIDGTVGAGGLALEILKKTGPAGRLLGFDLDPLMLSAAEKKLVSYQKRILLIKTNYKNLKQKFYETRFFSECHGVILDLGLSSVQLADQARGFSFKSDQEILMNYGEDYQLLAKDIIRTWPKEKLIKIFKEDGGEKYAAEIVQKIIDYRKQKQKLPPPQNLITASQLADLILQVYKNKNKTKIHPATKVFQALRINVNDELNNLRAVLEQALEVVKPGGRLAIISFHSGEDKIVKHFFQKEARDCLCPPDFPVCRCQHQARLRIQTKKPISPSFQEIISNPRARSAKLRVAEVI